MDSIRIYFSNDGGSLFSLMDQVSAPTSQVDVQIPSGVTDSAQVRLVAIDIYGNEGEDHSEYFSVTDNTPPEVTIEYTGDVHISDSVILYWSANDNTGLDHHIISLSIDGGESFTYIDSVSGSDDTLIWTVPNIDTENALLSIISTDLVGLVDSDTTDFFSIFNSKYFTTIASSKFYI